MKTTTTTHLISARVRWFDIPMPATIAIVIFFTLCAAGLVGRLQLSGSAAAAVPTPALPIIVIATTQPQPIPTAAPAAQVAYQLPATRWVTAFAAPDGVVLGPIPEPAMSAITGRYSDGWVSTMHEGATVWMRVSELGANLVDIAPAPAPQVIYQVANQPAQPAQEAAVAPIAPAAPVYAAEPTVAPAVAPAEPVNHDTDVERNWAQVQLCAEKGGTWCQP